MKLSISNDGYAVCFSLCSPESERALVYTHTKMIHFPPDVCYLSKAAWPHKYFAKSRYDTAHNDLTVQIESAYRFIIDESTKAQPFINDNKSVI